MTELERQQKKDEFIAYFEEVPVIKYAAMYIEITEVTAHDWLNKDEVFLSRVNQAKSKWAKKRALKTRAEFQLERLDKEIWSEHKTLEVIDPRKEILKKYGLGDDDDDGQTEEDASGPSSVSA